MAIPPSEPTNLVLEQLRVMRAEANERFDRIDAEISGVKVEIVDIKKDIRGLKLNTSPRFTRPT